MPSKVELIKKYVYLVGASIKDLGEKVFGFSRLSSLTPADLLAKLR